MHESRNNLHGAAIREFYVWTEKTRGGRDWRIALAGEIQNNHKAQADEIYYLLQLKTRRSPGQKVWAVGRGGASFPNRLRACQPHSTRDMTWAAYLICSRLFLFSRSLFIYLFSLLFFSLLFLTLFS